MHTDGLNWRFRPLYDPSVEFWISRDADSRLSWKKRMQLMNG